MLEITQRGARKVWEQPVHSKICSPVIHDGRIYWVYQTPICLDLKTGRTIWEGPRRFGEAGSSMITSDDRWILWTGRGDLILAETAARSPDAYHELARTPTLFRTDAWPHVVLAGGRLFCKDRDGNMVCFDIGRASGGSESAVRGDFRNWSPQQLLLGDEYSDPCPWRGRIERFAIHSRAMDDREIVLRDRLVRATQ